MRFLVFVCALLATEAAKLQGYSSQEPSTVGVPMPSHSGSGLTTSTELGHSVGAHQQIAPSTDFFQAQSGYDSASGQTHAPSGEVLGAAISGTTTQGGSVHTVGAQVSLHSSATDDSEGNCPVGQIRHVDGNCVTPEITRNVFVYAAPEQETQEISLPENIPLPKIEHNIVFIRTQDGGNGQDPIIVPLPQKKHIIYVLNKESEEGQKVIEVPSHPAQEPEVFFVNYADGETPSLPHGIDFETALNSAIETEGQLITGISGSGVSGGDSGAAVIGGGVATGSVITTDYNSNENSVAGQTASGVISGDYSTKETSPVVLVPQPGHY